MKLAQNNKSRWMWLLVLPYAGLLLPFLYARRTPEIFGVPFFYWYQFAWVFLTATLTGIVYWRTR
jgi:hypothetical protein